MVLSTSKNAAPNGSAGVLSATSSSALVYPATTGPGSTLVPSVGSKLAACIRLSLERVGRRLIEREIVRTRLAGEFPADGWRRDVDHAVAGLSRRSAPAK